uniref:Putative retrotransposon protein n=1 Tax=Phaseolus vulgaris TaxID=3885 RepID=I6ZTS8_PHAVU|nr:putative retrotransposon protein [Phaseolus vulgaris]
MAKLPLQIQVVQLSQSQSQSIRCDFCGERQNGQFSTNAQTNPKEYCNKIGSKSGRIAGDGDGNNVGAEKEKKNESEKERDEKEREKKRSEEEKTRRKSENKEREDEKVPLILGRPFIKTGRIIIDVDKGKLKVRTKDDEKKPYPKKKILIVAWEDSDFGLNVEHDNLRLIVDVKEEVSSNPKSSFALTSYFSYSSSNEEYKNYLSYEDLFSSCHLISKQYFNLKQKFEALLTENEKLKRDKVIRTSKDSSCQTQSLTSATVMSASALQELCKNSKRTCKTHQTAPLAAVCTPTLKSAYKTTKKLETESLRDSCALCDSLSVCMYWELARMYLTPYRGKLDPHAIKCVFIGYAPNKKGYKCYHSQSRKVYVFKDVTFHETKSFFPKLLVAWRNKWKMFG